MLRIQKQINIRFRRVPQQLPHRPRERESGYTRDNDHIHNSSNSTIIPTPSNLSHHLDITCPILFLFRFKNFSFYCPFLPGMFQFNNPSSIAKLYGLSRTTPAGTTLCGESWQYKSFRYRYGTRKRSSNPCNCHGAIKIFFGRCSNEKQQRLVPLVGYYVIKMVWVCLIDITVF